MPLGSWSLTFIIQKGPAGSSAGVLCQYRVHMWPYHNHRAYLDHVGHRSRCQRRQLRCRRGRFVHLPRCVKEVS